LVAAYEVQSVQWLDQQVPMQYFGGLLDMVDVSPIAQHYSPIIIARTGPHRVAVHVDEVIGNQEVVVKNVGPQVARVPGVAGATVLGNGEIVLIINPVALAQKQDSLMSLQVLGATTKPTHDHSALIETPTAVLVVDDSLTVRKVTQRLLTREGYDVILAKDGVDALKQLQDRIPDVVISDIEMPRMDGFDLVRNIRADAKLTHLPVIMISSRTADKHQNYAKSLGVDAFLGKPYSEETLLGLLSGYAAERSRKKHKGS
jgi:chemosensory pili system protein ChpA (sensor histidine kinase/response regulator)